MPKQSCFIDFYIDVSGNPKPSKGKGYEDIVISAVTFNSFTFDDVNRRFQARFNKIYDKKGHKLKDDALLEMVQFLNEEEVRMITIPYGKLDWEKIRSEYINEANLEEKVMALLYFYLIKKIARKGYAYSVTFDNDTTFGIKQTMKLLKRLLRQNNFNIQMSFNYRDLENGLRYPDWIAQSLRKCDRSELEKNRHYIILKNHFPNYYKLTVFKSVKI